MRPVRQPEFSERWGQILLADYRSQMAAENSGSDRRLLLQGELERDAATTLVFVLRSPAIVLDQAKFLSFKSVKSSHRCIVEAVSFAAHRSGHAGGV